MTDLDAGAHRQPAGHFGNLIAKIDAGIASRSGMLAFLSIAIGFMIRIWLAHRTFLVPDEAIYFISSNQHSPLDTYRASLGTAHPPLFFLIIYYARWFGTSELSLRLPAVLAGSIFPWVVYAWLKRILDGVTGLFALLLLTFSPALMVISAEIRPYTFLLLFMAAALYWLERGLQEDRWTSLLISSLCVYLAILTHYAGIWFVAVVAIYAVLRMRSLRSRKAVMMAWLAGQLGIVAILAWLYVSDIAVLRGGPMERQAVNTWLSRDYFRPGKDNPAAFLLINTSEVFAYLSATDEVGGIFLAMFLVGILLLFARGEQAAPRQPSSRSISLLLILPFAIGSAAAILRIYPYGGTRHSVYLCIFGSAGVGYAIKRLTSRAQWIGLLGIMIMLIACATAAEPVEFISPANQSRLLMNGALAYVRGRVPPGERIIAENESYMMMRFYLCPEQITPPRYLTQQLFDTPCGQIHLISGLALPWVLTTENVMPALRKAAAGFEMKVGDKIWIVHAGWNDFDGRSALRPDAALAAKLPEINTLPHQTFGENISVFEVLVPAEPAETPQGSELR